MVSLARLALAALCLVAVVVCQRPPELPWGGLVEEEDGGSRQATSLWTLLANLVAAIVTPLIQNIATGITNAITATAANRTLRYIPVPYMAEPLYRGAQHLAPRPPSEDGYPMFYREPSPRPASEAEPYRRRPPPQSPASTPTS